MVAAGHEELHVISQKAQWFMNSRMGTALITSQCLAVDLLILEPVFLVVMSFC